MLRRIKCLCEINAATLSDNVWHIVQTRPLVIGFLWRLILLIFDNKSLTLPRTLLRHPPEGVYLFAQKVCKPQCISFLS